MKIIEYGDFGIDLTVDSTFITVDSDIITVDTTQIIFEDSYKITIVPRKYPESVTVIARDCMSNDEQIILTTGLTSHGYLGIILEGFTPIQELKYEFIVKNTVTNEIVWQGQAFYTTKDVQNYQLNNSDENNLKF